MSATVFPSHAAAMAYLEALPRSSYRLWHASAGKPSADCDVERYYLGCVTLRYRVDPYQHRRFGGPTIGHILAGPSTDGRMVCWAD